MHVPQELDTIPLCGQPATAHGPLPSLFARYLTGAIADSSWRRIMSILDEADATETERVALASFLNDAWLDLGPAEVEVPPLPEVDDMMTLMRAA